MPAPASRAEAPSDAASGAGTVQRVLQLLSALADAQGPVGIKQVAEGLQLAPSTVHRLLQLLRNDGFVEIAGGAGHQYTIGPQFYRVAARVAASKSPHDVALPYLQAAALEFDETILFGRYLPAQRAMMFTLRVDGSQLLKYQIELHTPLSLVWGASGKSILAFLAPAVVKDILAKGAPSPATQTPAPGYRTLERELVAIREQGYAFTEAEKLPDSRGIAAPVYGPRGIVGSLCLTAPKARVPLKEIAAMGRRISAQAAAISAALGSG